MSHRWSGSPAIFGKSPDLLGPPEIRAYLLHLTRKGRLAASSIIVTVSAPPVFLSHHPQTALGCRGRHPAGRQAKSFLSCLSQEEVARFLGAVDNLKHRIILTICYATGLRISEAVRLRPPPSTASAWSSGLRKVKAGKTVIHVGAETPGHAPGLLEEGSPGDWLFPGRLPGQPVSPLTIDLTCRQVREQCGIGKPGLAAFIAPRVCRSSAGSRH